MIKRKKSFDLVFFLLDHSILVVVFLFVFIFGATYWWNVNTRCTLQEPALVCTGNEYQKICKQEMVCSEWEWK